MKILTVCILAILLLFGGCREDGSPLSGTIQGKYSYSAYNTSGELVVKGMLILHYQDSSNISGEWDLAAVSGSSQTGPQTGKGQLSGAFNDDILGINLNPNFVDNNVLLRGKITGVLYSGEWTYATFAGPTYHGTFEARKQTSLNTPGITRPDY